MGLSDAMMRIVASREAVHSALSNAITRGADGDDEVIGPLGTTGEFPPHPRFAFRCTTVSVTDHTFSFTSANVLNDPG